MTTRETKKQVNFLTQKELKKINNYYKNLKESSNQKEVLKTFILCCNTGKKFSDTHKTKVIGITSCNKVLKMVSIACGIDKNITTHFGRYTFAANSIKRGVPKDVVMDILGHCTQKQINHYSN